MKKWLLNIKTFLDQNRLSVSCILACSIIVLVSIIQCRHTDDLRQDNKVDDQNIKALRDSLRNYKLENGQLLSSKSMYVMKIQDLQNKLNISDKERKDIENKLGSSLDLLAKVQSQVKIDTLTMIDTIVKETPDTLINRFSYNNQWVNLQGHTMFKPVLQTKLDFFKTDVPLIIGVTKDYQFLVTTPNPYVVINDIQAGKIDIQKPKKWSIGISGGFGAVYDMTHKSFGYGPAITVGINYKIW